MPVEASETSVVISGNESVNASNKAPIQPQNNRLKADDMVDVPDGGWGWVVVLGSFVIHIVLGGITYSFGVFVEDFVIHFECSKSTIGGLGSLMFGVSWGSGNNANLYVLVVSTTRLIFRFSVW